MPDDRTDRPVEELIGWKWSRWYEMWRRGHRDHRVRAEVDDLADWLRREFGVTSHSGWYDDHQRAQELTLYADDEQLGVFWGSDILSAFVAAVRAVSEAS